MFPIPRRMMRLRRCKVNHFFNSQNMLYSKGFRGDVRFSYCVDVYGREVKLSSVTLDFFKCPQTQYLQGFPTLLPIFLLCNRYIRKIVKNDRFLYIPSKFYSRNSYILQGFSDFCLIPYYEEKVSNEDVNVVARLFQPCTMGEIRIMPTKLCGFPDLKCLYMESDLQKNG